MPSIGLEYARPDLRRASCTLALMIVFTDLSADRAKDYVDDAQIQDLKKPSYAADGVVLGEFHMPT